MRVYYDNAVLKSDSLLAGRVGVPVCVCAWGASEREGGKHLSPAADRSRKRAIKKLSGH